MVKLQLTTWERLVLKNLLQSQAGENPTLGEVRIGLAVLDILDFSADEKKEVGLEIEQQGGHARWNAKGVQRVWDTEISREHALWFLPLMLNARGYPMEAQSLVLEDKLKAALEGMKKDER